jgi:glycosyltransferase involved in cell wall biosynthesis
VGIGLCPLEDNVFNQSKSNLKYLEFAANGLPVVASAVEPYAKSIIHGETGLLVAAGESWVDAINSVTDDMALAGYNAVRDSWSWQSENIKSVWMAAIKEAVAPNNVAVFFAQSSDMNRL